MNYNHHSLKDNPTHQISILLSLFLFSLLAVSFLIFSDTPPLSNELTAASNNNDPLGAALAAAAAADKTLIIAVVNKAYVEEGDWPTMLELFLDAFWLGEGTRELLDHLLLVAVDEISYDRCKFLHLHCYRLRLPPAGDNSSAAGDGEEKVFMSREFIGMMWRRTEFLGDVLARGYNFIFTDTDVLWLRNPFPRLTTTNTPDLQISTDRFDGNQWSRSNPINTGFYMVRSNDRTISLFRSWYSLKDNSTGLKEQDVLQAMIREGRSIRERLGVRVRFLDTLYFSGFCQGSRDIRAVSTVHANCCRTIIAKVADLRVVVGLWKRFRSNATSVDDSAVLANMAHVACANSWK
ncbi:unnamed protein product [Linum tenue]|uniref:Nucleotide-diphospho-sugar transferase domain-containing protein n=1 Tax=Linum tenue TaxID=586396 RepID=A0AAV0K972_9ROSI|nr:unnamed protein product [Linum tenue]